MRSILSYSIRLGNMPNPSGYITHCVLHATVTYDKNSCKLNEFISKERSLNTTIYESMKTVRGYRYHSNFHGYLILVLLRGVRC